MANLQIGDKKMLDSKGFDLWADGYDKSVNLSEESNEYPFAGYKEVLNSIYNQARKKENSSNRKCQVQRLLGYRAG